MNSFDYHEPEDEEKALVLLSEFGEEAAVLAGGTDLILRLKQKKSAPSHVVGLQRIDALRSIRMEDHCIAIGAMSTYTDLEESDLLRSHIPLLGEMASVVGSRQIRNIATIGGNLCSASPSADSIPSLLVLDASVELRSLKGSRRLRLEEFLVRPFQTALLHSELLARIIIPVPGRSMRAMYVKHSIRNAMDLMLIGLAVSLSLDAEKKNFAEVKIALGAAGPVAFRAKKAEGFLSGKRINPENIRQCAVKAVDESRPRTSWRTTAEYRRDVIRTLTEQSIHSIVEKQMRSL